LSRPRRWPGGTALGVAVLTDVNCSFGRYESPERDNVQNLSQCAGETGKE